MSLQALFKKRAGGGRLAGLTAYDASFARLFCEAGCDFLLVGDSLGMVVQGAANTLGVSLRDVAYHTRCCAAGAGAGVLLIADLPFGSYETGNADAFASARRLLAAGAGMVKIEGGREYAPTVRYLTERGVPVCAHVGLHPQAALLTGLRLQGRDPKAAERIETDARQLSEAGASLMVLEMIPAELAGKITEATGERTLTIGIGAGRDCDGQIMVMHDLLGAFAKSPKFSKNFLAGNSSIAAAVGQYVADVGAGRFPGEENIPG